MSTPNAFPNSVINVPLSHVGQDTQLAPEVFNTGHGVAHRPILLCLRHAYNKLRGRQLCRGVR